MKGLIQKGLLDVSLHVVWSGSKNWVVYMCLYEQVYYIHSVLRRMGSLKLLTPAVVRCVEFCKYSYITYECTLKADKCILLSLCHSGYDLNIPYLTYNGSISKKIVTSFN